MQTNTTESSDEDSSDNDDLSDDDSSDDDSDDSDGEETPQGGPQGGDDNPEETPSFAFVQMPENCSTETGVILKHLGMNVILFLKALFTRFCSFILNRWIVQIRQAPL